MNSIMVGYGERDITPDLGVNLCGYGFYLDRKAKGVLDPLKVRTIIVKNKTVEICLISCDLIGLSIEFCDLMNEKIYQKIGIKEESILISCTHTHSGPTTFEWTGGIMGEVNKKYMEQLCLQIIGSAIEAKNNLQCAEIGYAIEEIEPIGYNRVTKELTPVDNSLNIIMFKTERNKKYSLINYACHPVTLGRNYEISADFPGYIIKEIESDINMKGVFFQGCCGDIDPLVFKIKWGSGTLKDVIHYGKHISQETLRLTEGISYTQDVEIKSIKNRTELPLNIPTVEEIKNTKMFFKTPHGERFHNEWLKKAIETVQKKVNSHIENVPIQGIKLGDVVITALPGEVFCEIGLKIKQIYKNTIVIGYANGIVGYIPTADAYKNENDYACYGAPRIYPYLFPFAMRIEQVILKETEKILNNLS